MKQEEWIANKEENRRKKKMKKNKMSSIIIKLKVNFQKIDKIIRRALIQIIFKIKVFNSSILNR